MPQRAFSPSRIHLLCACLWTAIVVACLCCNTASAQTFSIDLNELTEVYDELYPERTRTAVWDTIPKVDLSVITLGNRYHEVPSFLPHDFGRRARRVEYGALSGYRVTFEYPPTYSLEPRDSTVGAITIQKPRDLDEVPDLEIEFQSVPELAERVRVRSRDAVWRKRTREFIGSRQRAQRIGKGGITIDIPIPMPRQLESIFGPSEKTHINITGREEITFAGETRVVKPFIGVEGRESQSLFPSLDMKQVLDVRLTGTIGDKVNIQVDHSSEALSDDANRIRLNYTGYEDDVIQLIELGNTSLSLPGSQLVNVSTQSKGLFGVKVLAQLGSTDITFIASKQEGESSSASFSPTGGSIGSTETRVIRDIDYVKNKYFFFVDPDLPRVGIPDPDSGELIDAYLPDLAEDILVYRELKGAEINELDANAVPGRAWVDTTGTGEDLLASLSPLTGGEPPARFGSQGGWFELLQLETDYFFVVDAADQITPIGIELVQPISKTEQRALAVAFTNRAGDRVGGYKYNEFLPPEAQLPAQEDTLALVMIKSRSPLASGEFGGAWDYMMRNIYNLGLSNIDGATFELRIEDNLVPRLNPTTPAVPDTLDFNTPYIRIFGLDQTDQAGTGPPDNRIDLTSGLINLQTGTLTFPSLTPFAPSEESVTEWTDGAFWFLDPGFGLENGVPRFEPQYRKSQAIYTTDPDLQEFQNLYQYSIVVEAVSTTRTFRIDALNIIENSEVVTVDGQRLSRGTDYDIDYLTGEIELKGNVLSELTDASKIDIDYEYKPFGGGGSSSLVGFSTTSRIGENARLGSTFLYESKNVPAEKPRVGEEPTRGIVGSLNGSVQHQSDRLTRILNTLPLVDTDAPSTVNVNGEIAVSIPDPNTRGEAYLDDFEGVEDSDRISMSRRTWQRGSMPRLANGAQTTKLAPDTRLGFIWYNIEPELATRKRDLNPELDERENSLVTSLDIELDPGLPAPEDTTSWAGVMTGFGGGGLDLTQGQFIEFWVNDFKPNPADRGGKIRIDLGYIDENFYEPEKNEWDDEDSARDGFAAAYDDTGLDGLFNDPSKNENNESEPDITGDPNDPAGDDIDLSRINGRFIKANGTEGNRIYDTEDLDRSGDMETTDAFFSFVVDLADSAVVDIREQFSGYDGWVGEHSNDSWRLYRIKLSEAEIISNTSLEPALEQIKHMRIWFNDVNKVVHNRNEPGARRIQLSEFKVVGNRWEDDGIRDLADQEDPDALAEFAIGVISTKSDPGVYVPPIRPNVQNEVADKETSLFLRYDNLEDSTQVRILKRFQGNGLDLVQYRDLNFFVYADRLDSDLQYYFRMGTNENNYYEIAVPLTLEYFGGGGWCQVLTKLENLTQLKFSPADSAATGSAPDLSADRSYPIKMVGAPSLFTVRFLYAGIRSVGTGGAMHSGELWINDIYVGDVRRDIDFAQRANAQLNLGGGIISLSGGWTRTGPDFRGLRQRRGRGSLEQSFNFSAKTALQHFVPLGGFKVPVSGNYRRRISKPKFVPNSDTEISDGALQDSLETVNVNQGFSTSLSKKNSKNWLLKYTIDNISTSFSYNRSRNRAPAAADTTTTMNGTLGYQVNWAGRESAKRYSFYGVRWWLNSLDVRTSASRRTTRRWRLIGSEFRPDPYAFSANLKNSGTANYQPFKSVTTSFTMNIDRDLRLPHDWFGVDVGTEVRRNHNFKVNFRPPPIRYVRAFSPDVNITTQYGEDSSPNVRRQGDARGTRNANASRTASLKVKYDIGDALGKLFEKMGVEITDDQERAREARQPPPGAGGVGAGTPAGGEADTTAAPADTASAGPRADPMMAVRKLAQVLADVRRINLSVSQRQNSSYQRIPGRPDLGYQFGVTTESGVPSPDGPLNDPDQVQKSLTLNADSGVELSRSIDVAARYSRSVTDSDFRNSQSRSTSTTFPDVQLSWKNLERIGLFRAFFTQTQANLNLKKFTQESGRPNRDPDNTRESLTLSPSLLFTWKNDIKSTLGVSYAKNTSDTRGSKTEQTNISVNLDFKKTFIGGAGFKIPIPFFTKQVKWKSKLDTNLSIVYSRTGGKRFTEGTDFSTPIPSTSNVRVSPTVAYQFSETLSGRAFIDYGRSYNESTDQTITTVRVGVTAVFTF